MKVTRNQLNCLIREQINKISVDDSVVADVTQDKGMDSPPTVTPRRNVKIPQHIILLIRKSLSEHAEKYRPGSAGSRRVINRVLKYKDPYRPERSTSQRHGTRYDPSGRRKVTSLYSQHFQKFENELKSLRIKAYFGGIKEGNGIARVDLNARTIGINMDYPWESAVEFEKESGFTIEFVINHESKHAVRETIRWYTGVDIEDEEKDDLAKIFSIKYGPYKDIKSRQFGRHWEHARIPAEQAAAVLQLRDHLEKRTGEGYTIDNLKAMCTFFDIAFRGGDIKEILKLATKEERVRLRNIVKDQPMPFQLEPFIWKMLKCDNASELEKTRLRLNSISKAHDMGKSETDVLTETTRNHLRRLIREQVASLSQQTSDDDSNGWSELSKRWDDLKKKGPPYDIGAGPDNIPQGAIKMIRRTLRTELEKYAPETSNSSKIIDLISKKGPQPAPPKGYIAKLYKLMFPEIGALVLSIPIRGYDAPEYWSASVQHELVGTDTTNVCKDSTSWLPGSFLDINTIFPWENEQKYQKQHGRSRQSVITHEALHVIMAAFLNLSCGELNLPKMQEDEVSKVYNLIMPRRMRDEHPGHYSTEFIPEIIKIRDTLKKFTGEEFNSGNAWILCALLDMFTFLEGQGKNTIDDYSIGNVLTGGPAFFSKKKDVGPQGYIQSMRPATNKERTSSRLLNRLSKVVSGKKASHLIVDEKWIEFFKILTKSINHAYIKDLRCPIGSEEAEILNSLVKRSPDEDDKKRYAENRLRKIIGETFK